MSRELHAKNPLAQAIQEAERYGMNDLEIEYKNGYEEIYFREGNMGSLPQILC